MHAQSAARAMRSLHSGAGWSRQRAKWNITDNSDTSLWCCLSRGPCLLCCRQLCDQLFHLLLRLLVVLVNALPDLFQGDSALSALTQQSANKALHRVGQTRAGFRLSLSPQDEGVLRCAPVSCKRSVALSVCPCSSALHPCSLVLPNEVQFAVDRGHAKV